MSNWNDKIITEFRENEGRVGGPFAGAHLLLLGTTGAKTGEQRVSPVMYFTEPDGIYVVASKAGAPENPAWYHNLVANPSVTVERSTDAGVESYTAIATVVPGAHRDELYTKFAQKNPAFAGYQEQTERAIPIVKISATGSTPDA